MTELHIHYDQGAPQVSPGSLGLGSKRGKNPTDRNPIIPRARVLGASLALLSPSTGGRLADWSDWSENESKSREQEQEQQEQEQERVCQPQQQQQQQKKLEEEERTCALRTYLAAANADVNVMTRTHTRYIHR